MRFWFGGRRKGDRDTYVGADDGGDDGGGDDDAADAETGEDEEAPGAVEGVVFQGCESTTTCESSESFLSVTA